MSESMSVPSVPRVPVATRRVVQPMREDLVKQIKMTGARFSRQRFRVAVRKGVDALPAPGGYVLPAGTHEIVVDESEVESLYALLEPNEGGIAEAETAFRDHLVKSADNKQGGTEWRSVGADEANVAALIKLEAETTGQSVQSMFRRRFDRAILPLTLVEPIGPAFAPLEIDSDINVSAVAAAVASVMQATREAQSPNQNQGNGGNNSKRG